MAYTEVDVEGTQGSETQLKHLQFVRIIAINTAVIVSNLYDYAKQSSGPLKSTVGTVENAVTAVICPVYEKFKGVPGDLLVFLDKKALYHALSMNYISVAKLHSKLEGEANLTIARKLIDKMTRDGFVEAKSNRRLGKRVIHSDLTKEKLIEVKKALMDIEDMDLDANESVNKFNNLPLQINGNNHKDSSTCGVLHSIGSDLTCTRGRPDGLQNDSIRSEQTVSRKRELGNTPTSRAELRLWHPGWKMVELLDTTMSVRRWTRLCAPGLLKRKVLEKQARSKSQSSSAQSARKSQAV